MKYASGLSERLQDAINAGNHKALGLIDLSLGMEICRLSELDRLSEVIDRADARMYERKGNAALSIRGERAIKTGKIAIGSSRRAGDKTMVSAESVQEN